ncbi:Iqg1p Ecym_2146 [Eremothecium cymbalariae DBVPG|uniref:Calponin-homology (CH) domain-containing protein n=1 Tax=Eremothecium cymbalariae (strain CBS 270.75 / DBVPG 7215 / KCTC 17166 / NRRL Y-17582) TaxID=931890 RepID=G8JNI2_ERECY|nr:Hypothetical protein Ecym_2146 [Eremothecium cymbalariae DBVPG\
MSAQNGSPTRGKNQYVAKYLQSLGSDGSTALMDVSPSKLNPISPKASSVKDKLSLAKRQDDKENHPIIPSKNVKSNISKNPFLLQDSNSRQSLASNSTRGEAKSNGFSESESSLNKQSPSRTTPRANDGSSDLKNLVSENSSVASKIGSSVTLSPKKVDMSSMSKETLRYYEFLCRVGEAKKWIEEVIEQEMPSELELATGNSMRDGYYLARLTQTIKPDLVATVIPPGRLQFKHTQNINAFFSLVDYVGVPDLFRFELTDLYEKKNIPKVFETLHALSNILNSRYPEQVPEIQNLSGVLEFSEQDLKLCKQKLPNVRNFRPFKEEGNSISPTKAHRGEGLIKNWDLKKPKEPELKPALVLDFKKVDEKKVESEEPPADNGPSNDTIEEPAKPAEVVESQKVPNLTVEEVPVLENPEGMDITNYPRTPERQLHEYYPNIHRYISPQSYERSYMDSRTASILLSDPLLRTANTNLSYSPPKSFSYYSPGISRRMGYTSDITPRSFDRYYEGSPYSSYSPTHSSYSPGRRQRLSEDEFLDIIFRFQALSRGANFRYRIYLNKKTFELFENNTKRLQAACKGKLMRVKYTVKPKPVFSEEAEGQLCSLQSTIHGRLLRNRLDIVRLNCLKNDFIIRRFQVLVNSVVIRRQCKNTLKNIVVCTKPLIGFQATLRATLIRKEIKDINWSLNVIKPRVVRFQACCRGSIVKAKYDYQIRHRSLSLGLLERCQANFKGIAQRRLHAYFMNEIYRFEAVVTRFHGCARGSVVRNKLNSVRYNRDSNNPIFKLQAIIRGVLARFAIDLINDIVEANELIKLQAATRGANLRSRICSNAHYYQQNEATVLGIQSAVRTHQLRTAYHELLNSSTPSLWAVKKFVHILNESDADTLYSKVHKKKAMVNECNEEIRHLQSKIKRSIKKKDLLERRGIQVSRYLSQAGLANLEKFSEDKVPDNLKKQNSLYEKICYLLQVDSFYWKQLFKLEPHSCTNFLPKLFSPTSGKIGRRENMLFIKMIMDLMMDEMDEISTDVFLNASTSNSPWKILLTQYLLRHQNAETVHLLGNILESLNDSELDFESVPANIYKMLHPNEPIVPSHIAIDDNQTNSKYVENMTNIWKSTESVRNALTLMIDSIPMEIKYLCTKAYRVVADRSTNFYDPLRAIAKVLIENYVNIFFANRSQYGIHDKSSDIDNKVQVLCNALTTIFNLKEFNGYYTPLTSYVEEVEPAIVNLLKNMLISPQFENECDSVIYRDMGSTDRPTLTMKHQYLDSMIQIFIAHKSVLPHDDAIVDLLKQMESIFETSVPRTTGVISLELDPSIYHVLLEDDRSTLMYNETKRGLCYLMQVEDVETNLADLLTSTVLPEDNIIFQNLLKKYPSIQQDLSKKHLDTMGYVALKKHIMQRVKELTHLGIIDEANNYQSVLNDIANTIRSRPYVGHMNERELIFMTDVHDHLKKKENYLRLLSEALLTAISKSVTQVQKYGHYEPLKKAGLGNKIKDVYKRVHGRDSHQPSGIYYKWNTRQLYERGVICEIYGEHLKEIEVSFFGSSAPKFPDIDFRISTRNGEVYSIDMLDGKRSSFRYHEVVKFGELLEKETDDPEATIVLMRGKKTTFKICALLDLLSEVFFR